ncbi:MAG: hypothetical protein MJ225_04460 [Bacilli bacterium]|nr:hypothetical protein [Bacilli bacterium]
MKKKIFIIPAVAFLLTSLISCSNKPSFEDELINRLSQINSIKEINKLGNNNPLFKCGVEVYFEVPLNWNEIEGEKIRQRVVIDAKSFDIPNVVELQGYSLSAKYFNDGFTRELPKLINSNFIAIEHRFFDKSSYVNANYDDASGWEQLTVKNAAHDHNFIISELKKVFNKKWIATGHSKGGYITNTLACLFPETCDAYLPFVAPCLTQYDSRPSEFINNEAGDSTHGKEQAKTYRDNILKFQVFCYEHKNEIMPVLYSEKYCPKTSLFRDVLTKENLYDINLLDFSYGFWQYGYVDIKEINDFLLLTEDTADKLLNKIETAVDILIKNGGDMGSVSYNTTTFPYYVTAHKEMGNYAYNFSYVKAMAESLGKDINISIPDGQVLDYANKVYLSNDQITNFNYDITMYNELTNWIKDTSLETKIIMINGQEDPWYHGSINLPDTLPSNVKHYLHPTNNHRVQISSFPEPTKNEILGYICNWLDATLL